MDGLKHIEIEIEIGSIVEIRFHSGLRPLDALVLDVMQGPNRVEVAWWDGGLRRTDWLRLFEVRQKIPAPAWPPGVTEDNELLEPAGAGR